MLSLSDNNQADAIELLTVPQDIWKTFWILIIRISNSWLVRYIIINSVKPDYKIPYLV